MKRQLKTTSCFTICITFLFFICTSPLNAEQSPAPVTLTLKEAVKLALGQGPQAELIKKAENRLAGGLARIEKQNSVSRLNLAVAGLNNEVADSYDLEGQETRTGQIVGSYRKTYENGFYWQISQIIRQSTAISDTGEDSSLIKSILSADYPLLGKKRFQQSHTNRMERLNLESQGQRLLSEQSHLQTQIGDYFLTVLKEQIRLNHARKMVRLTTDLYTWENSNPDTRNFLKLEEIELENEGFRQQAEFHQVGLENGLAQIRLLTGLGKTPLQLLHPSIPSMDPSSDQLLEAHQRNNPLLQTIENQIASKMAEKEIGQHQSDPDLSVGATLGQSKDEESNGSNIKIYLNVTYEFGDGREDKALLASMEIEELNLKLELEKQKSQLLIHQTVQKLKEKRRAIRFAAAELNLTQRYLTLNQTMFEKRELSKHEVFKRKRKMINQTLELELANLGYWETLLDASKQIGVQFSFFLNTL